MNTATVTIWRDNKGTFINAARSMGLEELEKFIIEAGPAAEKDKCALLKLALFGDKKSAKGCIRIDENVTAVHGIEGDYDGETMPMAKGVESLRRLGVAALFYTSASHEPAKPRWRVLCFFAKPLEGTVSELRGQRKHWVGVLNAILGGVLKGESFALSQSFYYGRIVGRPDPEVFRLDGLCIDEIHVLPDPVYPNSGSASHRAAAKGRGRDDSDSGHLYRQILALVAKGKLTDDEIHKKVSKNPHVARQPDPVRAVQNCIDNAREFLEKEEERLLVDDESLLAEMNSKHAVINWKGRALILSETRDPEDGRTGFVLSHPEDLRLLLGNRPHRNQNPANWWLSQAKRRQYDGVVFTPMREMPGYFNLWSGFGYEPKEGDCSLFLRMVEDVICSGDKDLARYVVGWAADAVQNPTERPGVVLVLKGEQGTGKGTFGREVGSLFGNHFFHATASRQLTGKFNAHLANVLLMFADEAYYAGDKQSEGGLKALITEPTMPLEPKGKDIVFVRNHLRIVMASNQQWVVPASMDDRRFAVIEVSNQRAQDTAYFKAIKEQMENGGREALLDYLQRFALSGLDLRTLPRTTARFEQQLRSMSAIQKWWYGRLYSGAPTSKLDRWVTEVLTEDVLDDYINETRITNEWRLSTQTELGMELKQLIPGLEKTRVMVEKQRRSFYKFPALQVCRTLFAEKVRQEIAWPPETESAADRGSWKGKGEDGEGNGQSSTGNENRSQNSQSSKSDGDSEATQGTGESGGVYVGDSKPKRDY